nr:MAG TPA: hypothetical protein [Herelleviridae sp.]
MLLRHRASSLPTNWRPTIGRTKRFWTWLMSTS